MRVVLYSIEKRRNGWISTVAHVPGSRDADGDQHGTYAIDCVAEVRRRATETTPNKRLSGSRRARAVLSSSSS
jgi:hypothetical protein